MTHPTVAAEVLPTLPVVAYMDPMTERCLAAWQIKELETINGRPGQRIAAAYTEPLVKLSDALAAIACQVDAVRRNYLNPADLGDLMRFQETTEDDEGYDIGKPAIKRLAELGVVQSHGFGKYSLTEFGGFVLDHMFGQNPALPLMTNEDRNRAAITAKDAKP